MSIIAAIAQDISAIEVGNIVVVGYDGTFDLRIGVTSFG